MMQIEVSDNRIVNNITGYYQTKANPRLLHQLYLLAK